MLENTEGAIKNGQCKETGNIDGDKQNKRHHSTQANTNNINKTRAIEFEVQGESAPFCSARDTYFLISSFYYRGHIIDSFYYRGDIIESFYCKGHIIESFYYRCHLMESFYYRCHII